MAESNKPRRSSSDDILVGKHEAVHTPVAVLAEALGLRHDNLPREAGGRLSVQAQRLDKGLRDIYESLEDGDD